MIAQISKLQFQDAFLYAGKASDFSIKAIDALFDYLKKQENEDTPYMLDVIALCETYKEYKHWNHFKNDYPEIAEKCDKRSSRFGTSAIEELGTLTAVIEIPNGGFLVYLPIVTEKLENDSQMNINEAIKQLQDLAENRKTFFQDDDDDVYRKDYEALTIAVKLLDSLRTTVNDYKTIMGEIGQKTAQERNF